MDGVNGLLLHDRVRIRKIRLVLNPKLQLIGLLPTMVEATPFQRPNFVQVIQQHRALMILVGEAAGQFALIPNRSRSPRPWR
jgi:chromosome partitioning protein